jgi:hypothetical protein
MRDYLAETNLLKSAWLAVIITLMSVLRIMEGRMSLWFYVPAALLSMTLVCAAITAWSARGGMRGYLPEPAALWRGVGIALALAAALAPIYSFFVDPVLRAALAGVLKARAFDLRYPATLRGLLALVLWAAGFQTAFLCAAPMSLLSRLTGSWRAALVVTVALRIMLLHKQIAVCGVSGSVPLFYASAIATALLSCLLFARYGLPAAAAFVAALDLRPLLFGPR